MRFLRYHRKLPLRSIYKIRERKIEQQQIKAKNPILDVSTEMRLKLIPW